ncbi:MAG: aminopeptidase [Actinobacteria bacterium]|nr:MAG: aminopeptidase [Actinomycetota bacterium]TMM33089.1 MAG: aminopeptidase [Actinomycetota bacterium]
MSDSRHERLADVLVGFCARVREGDLVTLESTPLAAPILRELYRKVLEAGGQPLPRVSLEGLSENLLKHGNDEQLAWVNPARSDDIETVDVRIALEAPGNTRRLSNVDPARHARHERSSEELRNRYLERAAAGELRWVLSAYPTEAAAQDASMSLVEYEDFVYGAGFLDDPDPVARWQQFGERVDRLAAFLSTKRELRVVAEGTDLRFVTEGRTWIPSKGQENFPDGEVFTGPVETSVEGEIRFTYPGVFHAREVDDVRLRFEAGEVVEATASRGQEFLREMIAMDEGARRVGEFAFGLNEGVAIFTRNTLFDEKIGGTMHLALGTAYPETGGLNRSALHWDLICDLRSGSEVLADGELIYSDGQFLNGVG